MTNLRKCLQEVEVRIATSGTTIPEVRKAFNAKYSFSKLPFEEQLAIWDYIWKSGTNFRTQTQPFFFLETICTNKDHLGTAWETIKHWQDDVNDWPFCDWLSKIYTKTLEIKHEEVFPLLKEWNTSDNLWKRRQSLVSLLYYSRTKKAHLPFSDIIVFVNNLLDDGEYYVQKGLGWTLREAHNVYPEDTYVYLSQNIKKVKPIAFTIAIEKMDEGKKNLLKEGRRG